jgi:hypothetical protein
MCGWDREKKGNSGGQASGLKKRGSWQLTLRMGPVRAEFHFLIQRATIPSKRVIFTLINKYLTCI